ncbi:MAG: septal ring lytic transglycosylase RlpA family protein [Spirosomataceae bacterium]
MGKSVIVAAAMLVCMAAAPSQAQLGKEYAGKASFYGPEFAGRETANGERFSHAAFTAAHKELPFGTMIEVTNLTNNKSCVVRVNDRGPYAKGRIIDLSSAAAKTLGFMKSGLANVKIRIVGFDGLLLLKQGEYLIESTAEILSALDSTKKFRY